MAHIICDEFKFCNLEDSKVKYGLNGTAEAGGCSLKQGRNDPLISRDLAGCGLKSATLCYA